jgi:hypothetical protein
MIRFAIVDHFGNQFGPFERVADAERWAATQTRWPLVDWRSVPMRSPDYVPPTLTTADGAQGE